MPAAQTTISRLLLCSSDKQKLAPLAQRLQATGVAVDRAVTADAARELLWEQHYDGVAVDLLLADRDGISFAMELREEHPRMSILVVSTSQRNENKTGEPDWLASTSEHARLVFALKQASQRSAGRMPSILHVEDDDRLANLVQNTIGRQTRLFRARSAQEARIAMALRDYDLALVRTQLSALSDQWRGHQASEQSALCISAGTAIDPLLAILSNLRCSVFVHEPAYC